MNGNNGIVPTIDLATNGNNYPYPVMYGNNGGFGSGFGDNGALWLIVLLALIWGGNNGNGNGFFGNNGFDNGYAWLSNGQKDIMTNTNNGFDTLHLSNQLEGTRDGINSLSNQLCNCCADINGNIANGFYTSEVANCNRQMANMNQSFNNQLSTLEAFNDIGTQLASCCCENRLGIANLNSTILAENCADREALSNGIRDLISNQTANTQRILDQLCNDKIDAKNEKIADLQREILMKDLQASQVSQTATLRLSEEQQFDAFYNRLKNCPVNAVSVYGNQPVFTCPGANGCGCNGYANLYN